MTRRRRRGRRRRIYVHCKTGEASLRWGENGNMIYSKTNRVWR
jgi:hypothetical protein